MKIIWMSLCPGNDQLKKKVLEAGEGRDSRPQKGQNVKINLKTYLKDGTLVEEQPDLCFTLGDGDVIQVKMNYFWYFHDMLYISVSYCNRFVLFSGSGSHSATHGNGREGPHSGWCKVCIWCAGEVRTCFNLAATPTPEQLGRCLKCKWKQNSMTCKSFSAKARYLMFKLITFLFFVSIQVQSFWVWCLQQVSKKLE